MDWRFSKGNWSTTAHGLNSAPGLKIAVTLAAVCILGGVILHLSASSLFGPIDKDNSVEEVVEINPGMSAAEIGSLLEEKGYIRSVLTFRLASRLNGTGRSLKAGEYVLSKNMNTFQILRKISSGEAVLYSFTIPEGFTLPQIAEFWEKRKFGTAEDFVKATKEPSIREKYNIDFDNLEGYLFPDTYMFPRGMTASEAIDKMLHQYDKNMAELLMKNSEDGSVEKMTFTRHEVLSLASIIEKEAMVDAEMPIISAVFHNRLKRGRRLESCVTVLYSLGYPRRKLTIRDLRETKSPYNTYRNKGLPPGPICSPGRSAIAAALNPSEDKYLYFVAKNDGTHYFTENYSDFLNAKRRYKDG